MSVTVADLIDAARVLHWSFTDTGLGDGAIVLFLNNRQRSLLLKFRSAVQGLLGTTVQTAATVNGTLVGVTEGGTPYYLTTIGDGFPVRFTAGGTPYIDTDDMPISLDPFGASGGTPGFPLPTDYLAYLIVTAVYADGTTAEIQVFDSTERFTSRRAGRPTAMLSANRLVPIRDANATSDVWSNVTAVQLGYIPAPDVAALTDPIVVPSVLHEALTAGIAELLARQSKQCTAAERAQFIADARRAEEELAADAFDIVGSMQTTNVIFKR